MLGNRKREERKTDCSALLLQEAVNEYLGDQEKAFYFEKIRKLKHR